MNNKIDLEIRILDGILKLLNAICSSTANLVSNSAQNLNTSANSASSLVSASALINSLDVDKYEDSSKCSVLGAAIAAAVISSKTSGDSNQTTSQSLSTNNGAAFDTNSPEYNHVIQILTACKCLFVSHRKIAIYLQNLQDLEKAVK